MLANQKSVKTSAVQPLDICVRAKTRFTDGDALVGNLIDEG